MEVFYSDRADVCRAPQHHHEGPDLTQFRRELHELNCLTVLLSVVTALLRCLDNSAYAIAVTAFNRTPSGEYYSGSDTPQF